MLPSHYLEFAGNSPKPRYLRCLSGDLLVGSMSKLGSGLELGLRVRPGLYSIGIQAMEDQIFLHEFLNQIEDYPQND